MKKVFPEVILIITSLIPEGFCNHVLAVFGNFCFYLSNKKMKNRFD